ncbi:hypothetical protein L6164_034504 [Bauhinia variegata]|uniref:Uncharacterized protein n=1 Tax=Bauhinia variegata TaxID=167791 RepID=A0ACB9KVD8_BAUVA|nr:hypothetical protein L6164_034504 [Bauhinia variegata]
MKIPLLGRDGLKEITIGLVAVFDGHGGFESIVLEALKESLLKAIHVIDVNFSQATLQNKNLAGSTATVALMVNGKILVSNVGARRPLFAQKISKPVERRQVHIHSFLVLVISPSLLTKDHHPDRDDENARIDAAGGSIVVWGVPRVNGVLAMSRFIGDVYLKRCGVIAVPEITHWLPLNTTDKFLILSSDVIFESLTKKTSVVWCGISPFVLILGVTSGMCSRHCFRKR